MAVMNFFILTAAQRTTAMGWDNEDVAIGARTIDNASPGIGINLNDAAVNYEPGDPVTLAGCFVADKRMVDSPDEQQFAPARLAYLLTLPFCLLESETIFAPPEI